MEANAYHVHQNVRNVQDQIIVLNANRTNPKITIYFPKKGNVYFLFFKVLPNAIDKRAISLISFFIVSIVPSKRSLGVT